MKVVRDPRDLPRSVRTVAIGSFDGIHLGHRRVLDVAFETGLPVAVLTFDPHPRVLLGQPVELLTTLERKIELLVEYGVEEIVVLRFDQEMAQMTPEQAQQLLDAQKADEQMLPPKALEKPVDRSRPIKDW